MGSSVKMSVGQLLVAIGFNPHRQQQAHTALGEVWQQTSAKTYTKAHAACLREAVANPKATISDAVCNVLGKTMEQLHKMAKDVSQQSCSAMRQTIDDLIHLCGQTDVDKDTKEKYNAFIHQFFYLPWGSHHKEEGQAIFQDILKQYLESCDPVSTIDWFEPKQKLRSVSAWESLHPSWTYQFVGSDATLQLQGRLDCRNTTGEMVAYFKHEIYDNMTNVMRLPSHISTLMVAHIVLMKQCSRTERTGKHEVEACYIAEYHRTGLGSDLQVNYRGKPFQDSSTRNPMVIHQHSVDLAGRLVVTQYQQAHFVKFWEVYVEPRAKVFCQVIQRLCTFKSWQHSYCYSNDKAAWFEAAKRKVQLLAE